MPLIGRISLAWVAVENNWRELSLIEKQLKILEKFSLTLSLFPGIDLGRTSSLRLILPDINDSDIEATPMRQRM